MSEALRFRVRSVIEELSLPGVTVQLVPAGFSSHEVLGGQVLTLYLYGQTHPLREKLEVGQLFELRPLAGDSSTESPSS